MLTQSPYSPSRLVADLLPKDHDNASKAPSNDVSEPEYSPGPNVEIPKQTAPTIPPKVIQDLTPEPDADLEDTSDLDKLKKDIMKTLEKLDQVRGGIDVI